MRYKQLLYWLTCRSGMVVCQERVWKLPTKPTIPFHMHFFHLASWVEFLVIIWKHNFPAFCEALYWIIWNSRGTPEFVAKLNRIALTRAVLEKAMVPRSSILAWKIPWMEEAGGLQSMGSLRVGPNWATSLSLFHFHALEKEMATHSSVLAWRIPGTGESGGMPSTGLHRVGHDWSDLAAAVLLKCPARVKAGSLKCTVLCN